MADIPKNPLYIDILVIQEAALLGVSVRTLRDWEQGRQTLGRRDDVLQNRRASSQSLARSCGVNR
jgi:hypothetical protein